MLYLLFWLEAAAGTALLYIFCSDLHYAWMLPILLGFFLGLNLLYVLYLILTSFLFRKEPPERPSRFALLTIRLTMPWVTSVLGMRVCIKGKEKLPKEKVVYVCNHRSAFDPVFLMSVTSRRTAAFVSKASVQRYLIIGRYMNAAGFVFIDRESPMQSMRAIHRAAKYIREANISYGIFPEGTRSRDGALLPFKTGAFLMAKKAGVPIAVFTVEGSENAFSGIPLLRRPKITLRVVGIIPAERVAVCTHDDLAEEARALMKDALDTRA